MEDRDPAGLSKGELSQFRSAMVVVDTPKTWDDMESEKRRIRPPVHCGGKDRVEELRRLQSTG